jgi:hypothetical protein
VHPHLFIKSSLPVQKGFQLATQLVYTPSSRALRRERAAALPLLPVAFIPMGPAGLLQPPGSMPPGSLLFNACPPAPGMKPSAVACAGNGWRAAGRLALAAMLVCIAWRNVSSVANCLGCTSA